MWLRACSTYVRIVARIKTCAVTRLIDLSVSSNAKRLLAVPVNVFLLGAGAS